MPQQVASQTPHAVHARLLSAINEHRREAGLAPLVEDPIASRAAQYQAEDMQNNNVMRHKDANGRSPMTRYAAFGGNAQVYGENVAYYGENLAEGTAQWAAISTLDQMMMAEKPPQDGHRKNILSSDYSAVGIGVAVGPHGIFIAEDFVGPAGVPTR